jgi:Protein of unknown function (DUF2971)
MGKLTTQDYIKLGIENGNYPQYVYKYMGTTSEYFDDIFIKNQLMFPSPPVFNDPFDCQLKPVTNFTERQFEKYLNEQIKNGNTDESKAEIIKKNLSLNEKKKIVETSITDNLKSKGVLCLCANEKPDNLLLWSHYSDSHKGICLKFDMNKDLDFFTTPLNVIYSDDYPQYDHFTEQEKVVDKMIKTKSNHWCYEKEIRIVKSKNGLEQFNKSALVEVIFGCKMSNHKRDCIIKLIEDNDYPNVKFKQAIKKESSFKLDIVNV